MLRLPYMPYFVLEVKFTCHNGHDNVQYRYYQSKSAVDLKSKIGHLFPKTLVCSLCPPETPLWGNGTAQGNVYPLTDEEFLQLGVTAEPDTPII